MSTLSYEATGAAQQALDQHLPALVEDRIATRIFAKDHTLWGPDAESESAIRLGWVEAATVSQALVREILELRDALRAEGVTRIVLCGMGGSSLAPEVIAGTAGVELTVLDSTDPDQVRAALADRLAETAIVVSSKSGSTVETDSQRRVFEKAFNDAGIDAASRIIIVTDPGSPLDKASREAGYRAVFNADPNVGGRFSALTAFGLVPSGLAGVDIQAFLDEAEEAAEVLNEDAPENIGLALGTALGGTSPLRNKIIIAEDGSGHCGLRRLGRAAHRRIHRQARHRRPAGGGRSQLTRGVLRRRGRAGGPPGSRGRRRRTR
jgi:glucose-6-phosphate isomerase